MNAGPTILRSRKHLQAMRRAGRAAALTLERACAAAQAGVSTQAIDQLVAEHTQAQGGRCAPYLYSAGGAPFPGHVCTSINEVVCHGIPGPRRLAEGDIMNIDVTTELGGWHGDSSEMVLVGKCSPQAVHLVQATRRALWVGIEQVRPGVPLSAIGRAIESFARSQGCTVVRDFGGHGIGRSMHEPPHVPHHSTQRRWPVLQEGMCFTIEPMLCLGRPDTRVLEDGWTAVTVDGGLSAQAEHTLLVTRDGVEVLTRRDGQAP